MKIVTNLGELTTKLDTAAILIKELGSVLDEINSFKLETKIEREIPAAIESEVQEQPISEKVGQEIVNKMLEATKNI